MRVVLLTSCLAVCVAVSIASAADPPATQTKLEDVDLDEANLRVHFIDVGNGLAMLIESPGDRTHVFVDGGDEGLDSMERYVKKFVQDDPINIAIVTHADKDHYYGLHRILDRFEVSQFWNTGYRSSKINKPTSLWTKLLNRVDDEPEIGVFMPIREWVDAGTYESIDDAGTPDDEEDDVWVQFLNVDSKPPKKDSDTGRWFSESEQRNNASLVFKLVYKDVTFLVTGDINGRDKHHVGELYDEEVDSEEAELLEKHDSDEVNHGLKATVLQAAHHGSNGSSSLKFLRAVDPEWVVVPAGTKNYDHPDPDMLRRVKLAGVREDHVLQTDEGDPLDEDRDEYKDPSGDDSFIFETDGDEITRILWVTADEH